MLELVYFLICAIYILNYIIYYTKYENKTILLQGGGWDHFPPTHLINVVQQFQSFKNNCMSPLLHVYNCLVHKTQYHEGLKVEVHKDVLKIIQWEEQSEMIPHCSKSETHLYVSALCVVVLEGNVNKEDVPAQKRWTVYRKYIFCFLASAKLLQYWGRTWQKPVWQIISDRMNF